MKNINKIVFAIVMIAVSLFCWFKPEKHEVQIQIPEWDLNSEYYYNGKNGSYCEGTTCYLDVHTDEGRTYDYYVVDRDLLTHEDLDMYYYLAPINATMEELNELGFNENVYYEPIYNRSHRYVICNY